MDWTKACSLNTGVGTLVLAVAIFAAVRSGNRAPAEPGLWTRQNGVLASQPVNSATSPMTWT
jgi:hypothetical protein